MTTEHLAVMAWSTLVIPEGAWTLTTVIDGAGSEAWVNWDDKAPPTLAERKEGLAALGFTVVDDSPDAWTWHEGLREGLGDLLVLAAATKIRPLTMADLDATG